MVISLIGGLSPLAMELTLTRLGARGPALGREENLLLLPLMRLILLPASLTARLGVRLEEGVLSPWFFLSFAVRTNAAEPLKLLLCLCWAYVLTTLTPKGDWMTTVSFWAAFALPLTISASSFSTLSFQNWLKATLLMPLAPKPILLRLNAFFW